ncbi:MAG: hypothetical protein J07HR59_00245, partial [Halorubrum sp. J07HR59]
MFTREKRLILVMLEDDRAVSAVLGFVLVFGLLVASLSIFQAQVIPAENEQVEIAHYEQAQGEMADLQTAYLEAAGSRTIRSTTVTPGTRLPTRVLFVNGPPPDGTVQTTTVSNGTITASGFNVSTVCGAESPVETRNIVFDTDYQQFSDSQTPPYVYEHTVIHQQTSENATLLETDQQLLRGSTLSLFPFTDDFSRSGIESQSVEFGSINPITTNVTGPVSVTLPTTLTAAQWERLLSDEPNFESASQVGTNRVKLSLSDTSYSVRCAPVGNGFPQNISGTGDDPTDETVQWLDPSGQSGVTCSKPAEECTLDKSQTSSATVEARTNPSVEGADIDFAATDLEVVSLSPLSGVTDSAGRTATVVEPQAGETGQTTLITSGVGSSDRILFRIRGAVGRDSIVFTNSTGQLFTVTNGSDKITRAASDVSVIGPATPGLDGGGDSTIEVPFVNGTGSVKFVDANGITTLADQAKDQKSLLAVGQFNGSATSVFFANSTTGGITRANPNSGPVQVNVLSGSIKSANAILGIGDIDSDGGSELIFAGKIQSGSSNSVNYLNEDGSLETIETADFDQNNNRGIGGPA